LRERGDCKAESVFLVTTLIRRKQKERVMNTNKIAKLFAFVSEFASLPYNNQLRFWTHSKFFS
jgi:hypothetical protein